MSYNQMQRKTNSPDNSFELSKFNFVLKNTIIIMNLPIELYSKDIQANLDI